MVGTPDYIAPEILKGISTSNKTLDYWSLGVIMFEFLVGIPPFNDESAEKIFSNIMEGKIDWPEIGDDPETQISEQAFDLLKQLLNPDFSNRLGWDTIDSIKKHRFFEGIDWWELRRKPGPIIPRPEKQQHENETVLEKLQKFLQKQRNSAVVERLEQELEYLERLDLLVARNVEEEQLILRNLGS